MSAQNVEAITRWWQGFGETGAPDLDLLAPDVEIHDHDIPDAGVLHGPEGFVKWMEEWGSAWADYQMEVEELIDAGDSVVTVIKMSATGSGSGIQLERQDASVSEFRDGKIVRIDYFNSKDQALASVGLAGEQA